MNEEFALQKGLGNGGAIDSDKGLVGAVAVLIQGAGNKFLARPCLAPDQDGDGV